MAEAKLYGFPLRVDDIVSLITMYHVRLVPYTVQDLEGARDFYDSLPGCWTVREEKHQLQLLGKVPRWQPACLLDQLRGSSGSKLGWD